MHQKRDDDARGKKGQGGARLGWSEPQSDRVEGILDRWSTAARWTGTIARPPGGERNQHRQTSVGRQRGGSWTDELKESEPW